MFSTDFSVEDISSGNVSATQSLGIKHPLVHCHRIVITLFQQASYYNDYKENSITFSKYHVPFQKE